MCKTLDEVCEFVSAKGWTYDNIMNDPEIQKTILEA